MTANNAADRQPDAPGLGAQTDEKRHVNTLHFLYTPGMVAGSGKLKKSAYMHVAEYSFEDFRYHVLCGRSLPDAYLLHPVFAVAWEFMPLCIRCKRKAEAEYSGFSVLGEAQ